MNPDPEVVNYLRGDPPPQSNFTNDDFDTAAALLNQAANYAADLDASGTGWTPGLAIVIVRREVGQLRAKCYGYGTKRVGSNDPIGADTLFACASLSKPVSASLLAAAALKKSGWSWDAPVPRPGTTGSYQLAKSPAKEPPPLRQWLSHLTGLPDHAGDLIEDMNPEMMRHDLINNIIVHQTGITPGEFNYTNMGFTIGCIGAAQVLGGSDWESFALAGLQKRGMTHSTYEFVSAYRDTSDRKRAFPHQGKPDVPDLFSLAPKGWTWHVTSEADERKPRRQAPAGSLLSSAEDLGKFLIAHLNKEFGADYPPREPKGGEGHYSLGWNVANRSKQAGWEHARNAVSFNHSGAFSLGAGTFLRFDPDMEVGIAILSNGEPTAVPEALAQLFFKTLYRQSLPKGCDYPKLFATARSGYMEMLYHQKRDNYDNYHAKPSVPIPARIAQGKVFSGRSSYFGCDITIERATQTSPGDDGLFLMMGKAKDGHHFWRFPLRCIDDNPSTSTSTFVYETRGENEVGPSAVHFIWRGDTIVQIVDDWLNSQGKDLGVIDRIP